MADFSRDSMLEIFTYEMGQLVEQLEQHIIESEDKGMSEGAVNEIFRIMHTIKGSAAMMLFDNISKVSHNIEDLFFYIRENKPENVDYTRITDVVLEGNDFIKEELSKIESGLEPNGVGDQIIEHAKECLIILKGAGAVAPEPVVRTEAVKVPEPVTLDADVSAAVVPTASAGAALAGNGSMRKFDIQVRFEDGCEMENIRAYTLVRNLEGIAGFIRYKPSDIIENEESAEIIRKEGFKIELVTGADYNLVREKVEETVFLKDLNITETEAINMADVGKNSDIGTIGGSAADANLPLKTYDIIVKFDDGCEMENIRAYTVTRNLETIAKSISYIPQNILTSEETADVIKRNGFKIKLSTYSSYETVEKILHETVFMKELYLSEEGKEPELSQKTAVSESQPAAKQETKQNAAQGEDSQHPAIKKSVGQTMISVNINKLDSLLNLTGELVTSEAMVTQNPDLHGLQLDNFNKATRQLRKIINDIQDTVMTMRMVPLSGTFMKMHRIVRDMCKTLNKEVQLELVGEETEVDKNIIEHISDPLMHIIRNSVDHGIESPETRRATGKTERGLVTLEACNSGGDVLIIVKDDGAGIDKEKVMLKAKRNGLLKKPENEYTDKEICSFIFLPGFSTNENVTNYSGRGVGMDVVTANIEQVGGSVIVDSEWGQGTTTTLKIPLTLAIINGMIIKLGDAKYTIPINAIKESFKASEEELITDPDGNEMIMVRGNCYNVMRLHGFFGLDSNALKVDDGIMMMLEHEDQTIVVLADELIGEQQVVVKAIPKYIRKPRGLSGCTLLGNGDISLIVDVQGFFNI